VRTNVDPRRFSASLILTQFSHLRDHRGHHARGRQVQPCIRPPRADDDLGQVQHAAIHVAGDVVATESRDRHRPFRAPHHTISHAGLVGGGQWPRPGEISLAHRGVLFQAERSSADEMPEFGQHGLEVLRQPLEDKIVTISRAQGNLTFLANFMLIGAQNPCPCGYWGDPEHACSCSPMLNRANQTCSALISRYQKRLSGPLLDRIDIHVEVPRVPFQKLLTRAARGAVGGDPGTRRGGAGAPISPVRQREGWPGCQSDHQCGHGPDPGA
jgi:predicted ATPase with chaperone activity